ncbi:MAG: hypothetical protein A2W19_12805 [Spirochaetes bacterium RBG_16_49_21]|nr:MAG: hypothetical protein A2W19_12805 [Spirochaetes bacterium RBG_16_49_21]
MLNKPKTTLIALFFAALTLISCMSRSVKYLSRPLPPNTGVAVIVDASNRVKNVIMARFLARGFAVKAVNASDFYTMDNVFDIRDFKKISYLEREHNLLSLEKTFDNLYKMHYYNFEVNKAEVLAEMRNKWNVQYLVLLELKPFARTSWGRAIDLRTNDLIWIENYPTSFIDNTEKIVDKFIDSMTGKK